MNILVVDDDPVTRFAVASAVERLGHVAVPAADGADGWRQFEQRRPDVVVSDWAMPGLDGTELTRRIRADTGGYTFVMILTGAADDEQAREAMLAGADDVVVKPIGEAELERKLIAAERVTAMHRRMLEDARRDPLTGAGTRLRLLEDLAATCARVERYGHSYCVAMFGVDGDDPESLRVVGRALGAQIRSGDVFYRAGRREFVALLPEQAFDTARLATERLRQAGEASSPGVRVSAGLVMTGNTENTPEALVKAAEEALRQARESGSGMAVPDNEGAGTLRLLLADDDPVTRLMMGAIVRREPGFELVGEAEDATGAVELALRRRPDVVLLDVNMPGGGGARAAVQIREALPAVRIVAISADDSQMNQYDMMRAGAVGFITKGAPDDEILRVIRSSARW
jgi:diguanylate cyclase (GGDEF)-like protein